MRWFKIVPVLYEVLRVNRLHTMWHAFMFRQTNSSNKYSSLNNGWVFIQLFSLEEKSDFLRYRENTLRSLQCRRFHRARANGFNRESAMLILLLSPIFLCHRIKDGGFIVAIRLTSFHPKIRLHCRLTFKQRNTQNGSKCTNHKPWPFEPVM